MRALVLIALFAGSFSAFAGDGGYSNYTCWSGTGRTSLNVFIDHYSESEKPYTVRLIIDGQMVEYASAGREDQSINYDYDTRSLTVDRFMEVLKVTFSPKGTSAVIGAGFVDPRVGTALEYEITPGLGAIELQCLVFERGP